MKTMVIRGVLPILGLGIPGNQDGILANEMWMTAQESGGLILGQNKKRIIVLEARDHMDILSDRLGDGAVPA